MGTGAGLPWSWYMGLGPGLACWSVDPQLARPRRVVGPAVVVGKAKVVVHEDADLGDEVEVAAEPDSCWRRVGGGWVGVGWGSKGLVGGGLVAWERNKGAAGGGVMRGGSWSLVVEGVQVGCLHACACACAPSVRVEKGEGEGLWGQEGVEGEVCGWLGHMGDGQAGVF